MAASRPDDLHPDRTPNPPPLTVAASLVGVQGVALVGLALVEAFSVVGERVEVAVSVAVFFGLYGVALLVCAVALTRQASWARGPALLSQLISIGIAWNLRDVPLLAVILVVVALVTLAGLLSAASLELLSADPDDPDEPADSR